MQKPYNINLFGRTIDAKELNAISWSTSGDISVHLQVKIYRNSDSVLVYDSTKLSSYALKFTLPIDSLINGIEYQIDVTIWNSSGASATSEKAIFQTSSRPVVSITTVPVINSSTYNFSATYSQLESVSLQSWIANLYSSNQVLISQSSISTSTTLEYLFSNLQSEKDYYVEFQATSEKTLIGTSGLIKISVLYTNPFVNATLTAENVANAGIKLSFHVIQVIAESDCDPVTYIDDEKIDLTNCRIWFQEGFSLKKDFTIKLWVENPPNKTDLLILLGDNGEIRLQYFMIDQCFHLFKTVLGITDEWVSQPVLTGNNYFVCLRQTGSDMEVVALANS